jgi:hypothetical protein
MMSETDCIVKLLAAKYGFDPTDASAYLAAAANPKPPGYFVFVEDIYLGSGFSQQKIAALAASSQQLAEKWEDLSEAERTAWNDCAIRRKPLKPP